MRPLVARLTAGSAMALPDALRNIKPVAFCRRMIAITVSLYVRLSGKFNSVPYKTSAGQRKRFDHALPDRIVAADAVLDDGDCVVCGVRERCKVDLT